MRVVSGLFAGLIGICLSVTISAQVRLPRHPMGFKYSPTPHALPSSESVTVKAFLDLQCPDSLQAFRTLQKIMPRFYNRGVGLTVVLFPLPFHRNSYELTKATYAVDAMNSNLTYDWISTVYDNIRKFKSYNTMNYTTDDVIFEIMMLATQLGLDGDKFLTMYDTRKVEMKAITSFKYGCLRGVASTPSHFVNDIPVLMRNNFPEGNIGHIIAGLVPKKSRSVND